MKSISPFMATLAATVAVLVSCAAAITGAEANLVPRICRSTGPISVSQLGDRVNLKTCPIRGRLIVLTLANGQPVRASTFRGVSST